jgi:hypothetical protein
MTPVSRMMRRFRISPGSWRSMSTQRGRVFPTLPSSSETACKAAHSCWSEIFCGARWRAQDRSELNRADDRPHHDLAAVRPHPYLQIKALLRAQPLGEPLDLFLLAAVGNHRATREKCRSAHTIATAVILCLEVQWIMRFAAWVEGRTADRADRSAFEILADGQFSTTGAAQNRLLVEPGASPDVRAVVSFGPVAIKTRVIRLATLELDRHDIKRAPIVSAAGT